MTDESPKRRRWFQFRLRTLLIAALVLSLPLSWFAWRMEKAKRQREAVQAIEKLGGEAYYDWQGKFLLTPQVRNRIPLGCGDYWGMTSSSRSWRRISLRQISMMKMQRV